jgi:prolyl oligopeptidase
MFFFRYSASFAFQLLMFMKQLLLPVVLMMNQIFLLQAQIIYPETRKIDHHHVYFGKEISDPYQWLEDDRAVETKSWVAKQNKVTEAYLSTIPYRDELRNRLAELANYPKYSNAFRAGNRIIYAKNEGLQNQPIWYIREGLEGEEYVLLDPNLLNDKGTSSVRFSGVSKDQQYATVNISESGSDWSIMRIMDLRKRTFLEDELKWIKFSDATWLLDGFFYSRYPQPEAGRAYSASSEGQSIYYHSIGTAQEQDLLIYSDTQNQRHYHQVSLTSDSRFLILTKSSGTDGYETYYRDMLSQSLEPIFSPLFQGFSNKNNIIGHHNGLLYVHTNMDAPNYRVIALNAEYPIADQWIEIIPEGENVLQSAEFAGGKLLLSYLINASTHLYVSDMEGNFTTGILLPGLGTATITHAEVEDSLVFVTYSSYAQPGKVMYHNVSNGRTEVFFEPNLTFDPDDYEIKQIWYTSKDGVKIPMFITHQKGLVLDGTHPTYLYGYGGFNISLTPTFNSMNLALLEQGVVMAVANLRGGGEFGEEWHQAGMKMKKQNVFDDFISAAEYLIAEKYTSSQKLAISGRSNGGLLVGACMIQRPDLFKVAFPAVGVLDMLKYQNFTVGWGWVPEYGSSDESQEMFEYLYAYSPYHQLKEGVEYPATLVTTADHDDRVVPAHSFKFTAKLQAYHRGDHPVLIRVDSDAGHGAGKPIGKQLDEFADLWSFFLWNVGQNSLK